MARREKLKLGSPHWVRIERAYELAEQQTGDEILALVDLGHWIYDGRLRVMWRAGDERHLLTKADLADVRLLRWQGQIGWEKLPLGAVVFAWKPDIHNIFGADEPAPKAARNSQKSQQK